MSPHAFRRTAAGVALALALGASVAAADISGSWGLEFQRDGRPELYQGECSLKQEGDRLSGSCLSGFENIVPVVGSVKDATVTFRYTAGIDSGSTLTFSGQLDERETSIKGKWRFVDPQGNEGGGTFTATKR
jgi:hypothetical protein